MTTPLEPSEYERVESGGARLDAEIHHCILRYLDGFQVFLVLEIVSEKRDCSRS